MEKRGFKNVRCCKTLTLFVANLGLLIPSDRQRIDMSIDAIQIIKFLG